MKKALPTLLLALAAALAAPAHAASAQATDRTVVHAGHLLDVDSGKMLADQAVTLADGKVVSVQPWSADAAKGARVLDWTAWTVVPGLMDMHTHISEEAETADIAAPLKISPAQQAFIGAMNARKTLQAGFTTVRDVGVYRGFADIALRDAINAGEIPGPRMFVAGAYITAPGGGGEITGLPPGTVVPPEFRQGVSRGVDQVRQNVDKILDHGADLIKVIATGAVLANGTEPGKPEFTEAEIHAAVVEAAKRGKFVAAHAHGAEGIKRAIRAGVRSIEHGSLIDDEGIALLVKHGTWLVADIYDGDYIEEVGTRDHWSPEILRKNEETTLAQREGFRKAVKAGVHLAFGTDAGVYPHGQNARQFAYMVRWGMTPLQAIRSATIDAARLLGKEKELGSIAPGKAADLVAVGCDPLHDIDCLRSIRGVIKAGTPVSLE
ncbi:xaa-Pro dipeptidase [Dyella thiooxydans]|uniref:Xaa-Pro dipeptidase n=1 Tax=Dyella thiooxydans TaxID=445710 RepID=A0A160MZW5_9GAMM|nr:amidohydrolase family protein [Dyella thiooxydans]AND69011.1 xaa-Pro dipeptidase [Dyella thiooxydans]